jgi:hypothetical protein
MLQVSLPAFQAVLSVRGWEVVDGIGHPPSFSVLFYLRYYGLPIRNLLAVVVVERNIGHDAQITRRPLQLTGHGCQTTGHRNQCRKGECCTISSNTGGKKKRRKISRITLPRSSTGVVIVCLSSWCRCSRRLRCHSGPKMWGKRRRSWPIPRGLACSNRVGHRSWRTLLLLLRLLRVEE